MGAPVHGSAGGEDPGLPLLYGAPTSGGYTLQFWPELGEAGHWTVVTAPIVSERGYCKVMLSTSGEKQFFRVRKQDSKTTIEAV
ncbi:MAG TPA: hypothetical protein VKM56_05240 [Verrucomicrobiae bacterium]|nr:hypothetical protein [Verrucomicrobiae bacterium]